MLPVDKLESFVRRAEELDRLLCDPAAASDQARYRKLNRERAQLEALVTSFDAWKKLSARVAEDRAALADPELRELVADELPALETQLADLERELVFMLLPPDPHDDRNVVLEIRAAAGGDEATLFAADLFRMYLRYAEKRRWRVELLSESRTEVGGFREVVALVSGEQVYSTLRFEAGTHRVQRVPSTEAQGRVHTSTATVAVLPEAEEVDVQINDQDLQITTAASGGPGGQGVNTTNSAVQVIHKPTGLLVKSQEERSWHKNIARAMKILRSRLLELERQKQDAAISAERRGMVGGGERAEKIRTYNFPQNRVTDHRAQITLYKLDRFVNGELDEILTPLRTHHQAERLRRELGIETGITTGAATDDD
ncbi:MAG: peptide chain release factor 1 [Polyangiales bacterium]